jgi:L-iditol 2-dehydrogenase
MEALVKTRKGVGFLDLIDVPQPVPGDSEVLIEVKACGICGTDLHIKHDEFRYWPPVVLGHEFAGEIVEVGRQTGRFKVGDRVVGEPHTQACGHCYLCRTGNVQICPMKRSPGWGINGGFTKFLKLPEVLLHRIPEQLSYEDAALVEPTANAVHDVIERVGVSAGDFVVIFGPGPIGLLAGLTARAAGARHVVMIGTAANEIRLKAARELGFETMTSANIDEALSSVLDQTGGSGADLVIECSGAASAIAATVDFVRKKGRICAIGLSGKEQIAFPWDKAAFKVCDIIFNLSTSYSSWDRTINLIASGQIPAPKVISHKLPLRSWARAFDLIEQKQALKVLLIPE